MGVWASRNAPVRGLCLGAEPVPTQAWGVAIPRDGGGYDVQASAPGKKTGRTHVDLKPSKQSLVVDVPPLEDERPPEPSAKTAADPEKSSASALNEAPAAEPD